MERIQKKNLNCPYWGVTILIESSLSQDGNLIMLCASKADLWTSSFSDSKSTWQNAVEKWTKACETFTLLYFFTYFTSIRVYSIYSTITKFIIRLKPNPDHLSINERTWFVTFRYLSYVHALVHPSKTL